MAKHHSPKFMALVEEARKRVPEHSVEDVKKKLDGGEKILLIDCREAEEYQRGHIPGAQWMGKGIIERDIEKAVPDLDAPIVLYCGGGFRSALAGDNLMKMGYTHIRSMWGGWRGWVEAGHPTEKASEQSAD